MSTQIEVANMALILLGNSDPLLVAVDGTTKHGRILTAAWDIALKAVLHARPWGFAKKRARLAASGTQPEFGQLLMAYKKPQDFVRFYAADFCDATYQEEGEYLLSDFGSPFDIVYVGLETNVARWSGLTTELLAYKLAANTAYAITGDKSARDEAQRDYARALSAASVADSFNESAQELDADVWIRAHQRGTL